MRTRDRYAHLFGSFWRHPRTAPLSPAAKGLFASALSYCADHVTDGRFPKVLLPMFAAGADIAAPIGELTAGSDPTWIDRGGEFEIHDYLESNLSRAEWDARHKAERERWERRKQGGNTDSARSPSGAPPESGATPDPLRDHSESQRSEIRDQRSEDRDLSNRKKPRGKRAVPLLGELRDRGVSEQDPNAEGVFVAYCAAWNRDPKYALNGKRRAAIEKTITDIGVPGALAVLRGSKLDTWADRPLFAHAEHVFKESNREKFLDLAKGGGPKRAPHLATPAREAFADDSPTGWIVAKGDA